VISKEESSNRNSGMVMYDKRRDVQLLHRRLLRGVSHAKHGNCNVVTL
jgi:hypothetical protein